MKFVLDCETTGLDAFESRILSISILNIETNNIITFYGEDERKVLEQFWTAVSSSTHIVTYCGDSFDIPFIVKRSLINNIKVSDNFRDGQTKLIDLYKVTNSFFVCYDKTKGGKLSQWAISMNISIETDSGKMMPYYYQQKDWKSIKEHNEEDVKITKALYDRCVYCNLIKQNGYINGPTRNSQNSYC